MTITIFTHYSTLIKYARELSEAEKSGNKEEIEKAKNKHDEYRDLCLRSDQMIIPDIKGIMKDNFVKKITSSRYDDLYEEGKLYEDLYENY